MEYYEVIHKRRMYRSFTKQPVESASLERILSSATQSPSAGFAQGFDFLVIREKSHLETFWNLALTEDWKNRTGTHKHLWNAPVVIIPLAHPEAYLNRYTEQDKSYSNLDSIQNWPVPYWYIDCAFSTMNILNSVTDEGLGALFFGLFRNQEELKRVFSIPGDYLPIGAIAIGHPAPKKESGSSKRGRRDISDQFHLDNFGKPYRCKTQD